MLFCLDAGHCLLTPERRCLKSIDPNETQEWILNNRIATYVTKYLEGYNCEVERVDDVTGKTDVSLQDRVAKANSLNATAYISIHHNVGIQGGSGGGIVVYKAPDASTTSGKLQKAIYKYTTTLTGLSGNRANPMPDATYYVLEHTSMPAVLGEFGFMDSTTDVPVILTNEYAQQVATGIVDAIVDVFGISKQIDISSYKINDNLYIVPCKVDDFAIVMTDKTKKESGENTINAGFFGGYAEGDVYFTLPAAHLTCDYEATSIPTKYYCKERGWFNGDKFYFDSAQWSYQNPMYGKAVSSLIVQDDKATIAKVINLPTDASYVISGVPVIIDGEKATYADALAEGWETSNLRATWHSMVGLKNNDDKIYIIGWKSTSANLLSSEEAYKVFVAQGFSDVIKLDGGGSFYLNINGVVEATSENRHINSIIRFTPWINDEIEQDKEPEQEVDEDNSKDEETTIDETPTQNKIVALLETIVEKLQAIVNLIKSLFK